MQVAAEYALLSGAPAKEVGPVRGKLGLPIERDLHFEVDKTLSVYADEARSQGRIVAWRD